MTGYVCEDCGTVHNHYLAWQYCCDPAAYGDDD